MLSRARGVASAAPSKVSFFFSFTATIGWLSAGGVGRSQSLNEEVEQAVGLPQGGWTGDHLVRGETGLRTEAATDAERGVVADQSVDAGGDPGESMDRNI